MGRAMPIKRRRARLSSGERRRSARLAAAAVRAPGQLKQQIQPTILSSSSSSSCPYQLRKKHKIHSESASSAEISSGPRMKWAQEHKWALFEEGQAVIDAAKYANTRDRNRQIADRLSVRFPHVNPKFTDETVRTQLRTLARNSRAGTVMEWRKGNEVVPCSEDLLLTLFGEPTNASEGAQSVPGSSMTVSCIPKITKSDIKKSTKLVESLPLTAPQKIKIANILKLDDNMAWFLSWTDPDLRLAWVMDKLGLEGTGTVPSSSSAGAHI